MIEFELTFNGGMADEGLLEFYDAARALAGFQRSLALTTHLVLNGEIITQAPSAVGFQIYVPPFIQGSWKTRAKIVLGAAFAIGAVGRVSPVGQVVTSVYDAVLSTTMGFHVDYDKTLQELYYESHPHKLITMEKVDSLCAKIESSVADMHRPIVISETATRAQISRCGHTLKKDIGPMMSPLTYEYVKQTTREQDISFIRGYISSDNINTYKGRLYSLDEGRPVPFELDEVARHRKNVGILTTSQHLNGQEPFCRNSLVEIYCNKMISSNGKVKRYIVFNVKTVI